MCSIRTRILLTFVGIVILLPIHLRAQENFTGYFQPSLALNYGVATDYSHNFSIANRNYFYDDEAYGLRTRQLDLVHFSKLKVGDNKSLGLGIQYRFRKIFESEKDNEIRLTQQYNVTFRPRVLRIGHRIRTEQRITPSSTVQRFRYRFALDRPLQGEELNVGEAYFIGSAEALLSVSKSSAPQYDQRFSTSLGWLLTKNYKIQLGVEYRFENYTEITEHVFFIVSSLVVSL